MHSPALALNWQVWGRHRWGLAAALLVVAGICAIPHAYPPDKLTGDVGDTGMPVLAAVLMPFAFVMIYLAYVFSHAEFAARVRPSGFPAWMLTLPVRTPWLVLWPMLTGAATVALAWVAVGWLALNRVGLEVPLAWPALGLACTLVWIQAIDWSPLGSVGKALVAGGVLAGLWTGLMRDASHAATFAASPGILLLGFVAGAVGVSRVRRGGRVVGLGLVPTVNLGLGREWRFASPGTAQLWLECWRNGTLLPLLAVCWVLLIALFMALSDTGDVRAMMAGTPYLILMLAPLAGLLLGKPDVWSRQVRLPTFAACRPLSCGDMLLAKVRMTALSLLAAWLVLAAGLAVWLCLGTHSADLRQIWERIPPEHRTARLYLLFAAALVGFFGFTLHLMAGTFVVSFAGRFWMMLAALFLYLGVLPNLAAMGAHKLFEDHLVETAAVALAVKLLLAAWAFRGCYRRGLISGRGIAVLVAGWSVTVGSALLAFYLEVPSEAGEEAVWRHLRNSALGLALFCPLFRLALAPAALAWNRHR
jgi:hypothetical protein